MCKKSTCDRLWSIYAFLFISRDLMKPTVHLVDVWLAEGFQAFTYELCRAGGEAAQENH